MSQESSPLMTVTARLDGPCAGGRLINYSNQQAGPGEICLGVASTAGLKNDLVPVIVLGSAIVEAGGIFDKGDPLAADSSGRVVLFSGSGICVGRAMSDSAGAGRFVEMLMNAIAQENLVSSQKTVTGGIEIAGETVTKNITPKQSATSTVYMFKSPITLATSLVSDQRECYVPTDVAGVYLGAFFGKRLKPHTSETMTDLGLFIPGLHTWHGSLTKGGTWTTSPATVAAGAFQSTGAAYSLTAGDAITGTVVGTAVAIRTYLTTVGGYGIVSIDGDWTRANKLPMFTSADFAGGFCRESDIGKRYYSCGHGATSSDLICLASDLLPGTHEIKVEVTGKKPAVASAARVYVEGFAGCNGETLGTANVYAVPIEWVHHTLLDWSAFESVTSWAPTGSVDYQFLGNIHGDNTQSKEVTTSVAWYVNTVDQTALAAGAWASGQVIRCDHASTLAHKVNTATVVANRSRRWILAPNRKHPVMCEYSIEWLAAGVVNIEYPVMLPMGRPVSYLTMAQDVFDTAEIGHYSLPVPGGNDNSVTYFPTETRRLIANGKRVKAWAELVSETPDRGGMYASSGGSIQDRSAGDKKLYAISAFGPQPYAAGDKQRFVTGWGARLV